MDSGGNSENSGGAQQAPGQVAIPPIQPEQRHVPFYERNLFWGLVSFVVAAVLVAGGLLLPPTQLAKALLWIAWLVSAVPLWLAWREVRNRWVATPCGLLCWGIVAISLFSVWDRRTQPAVVTPPALGQEKSKDSPTSKTLGTAPGLVPQTQGQPSHPEAGTIPPRPPTSASAGQHFLSVEWHSGLAPIVPKEGRVFVLDLWPLPAGGGGLSEMFGEPGYKLGLPPVNRFDECRLTNYSATALFNVRLTLHLTFWKVIKDPKQPGVSRSGDVSLSRDWPIAIQKIDTGPDHPFIFYIYNQSDQVAQVSFPEFVTAQIGDNVERQTIRLIRPEGFMMPLSPFTAKRP